MMVPMRDRTRHIPSADLRCLLGDKVMVYTGGDPTTYLDSGCVLRWNDDQGVYHRSEGGLDMAIAASWRIDTGYGWGARHDGAELERLQAWIARERYLIFWCIDWPKLTPRDRRRYAHECQKLALEMGRPVNAYKREMLAGTLRARTGSIEAAADLREAAEAGQARIFQIEGIAPLIDMRRVALFHELDRELTVLAQVLAGLKSLDETYYDRAIRNLEERQRMVDNLQGFMRRLDEVVNRPMRNVARRTVSDDLEPLVKVLHTGPINGARKYLKRAIVALHIFLTYERPLAALRVRLSLALARRGMRSARVRDGLYADLRQEIEVLEAAIADEVDKALRNPPLARAHKHLVWASLEWTSEKRQWRRVKDELDKARKPF